MSMPHQPPSVLLEGAPGAGKTYSIPTLIRAGLEVFVISTEPSGVDSLIDAVRDHKLDMNKLHWASALPGTEGWDALDEMTSKIGSLDFKMISELKGIGKNETRLPAMRMLNLLKDFECERDGKKYGSFTTWGPDKALVIDSLSGLSTIAWYLTVGFKPTAAPGEWNIAQNWLETLLMKINSDRKCFFVLTAHVEKELDEISGTNRVMVSTLGRKLAPKIPRFFSEVVYAQRTKDKSFTWSTIDNAADLKNRALAVSDKLPPDFGPVVTAYLARIKQAS